MALPRDRRGGSLAVDDTMEAHNEAVSKEGTDMADIESPGPLDHSTADAVGKATEALEYVERARRKSRIASIL